MLGGAGDDKIYAGSHADMIDAGKGDDYIQGGGGDSMIVGGEGNDRIDGGSGNETIWAVGGQGWASADKDSTNTVDGGGGNDTVFGSGGKDWLMGGIGNDTLNGGDNSDTLDGGNDNDLLQGGADDDTLMGGSGNDELHGDFSDTDKERQGKDFLDGGDGDDLLIGYGGNDTLLGGTGNDELQGDEGNDRLDGGVGDDRLFGCEGQDTLIGGAGVDYLAGGAGHDVYVLDLGNGGLSPEGTADTVFDESGADVIQFGAGISLGDISARTAKDPGTIAIGYSASDSVVINVGGSGGSEGIERFAFASGESCSLQELIARLENTTPLSWEAGSSFSSYGGRGADSMLISRNNATVSGGRGDDEIILSGNNATVLYGVGDGADTISTTGSGQTLRFGAGITLAMLALGLSGRLIQVGTDPANRISLNDVSNIEFLSFDDGSTVRYADFVAANTRWIGTDGNDCLQGSNLADWLSAGPGQDTVCGAGGDDTLDGGIGNDLLTGDEGADVFVASVGSGKDHITDFSPQDTLSFGEGIDRSAISATVGRDANGKPSIEFDYGNGDSITLDGIMASPGTSIEGGVSFSGGTTASLSIGDLLVLANKPAESETGSDAADLMDGGFADDSLAGGLGNDSIYGWDGNDRIDGGGGNNHEIGGAGNDTLLAFDGDDSLDGGSGNDVLVGGGGFNLLEGGGGNDRYLASAGAHDRIRDNSSGADDIYLPSGMMLSDFRASRFGNDLTIRSRVDQTAIVVEDYFAPATKDKTWLLITDSEPPVKLADWVPEELSASVHETQAWFDSVRQAFVETLDDDLNRRGRSGESLDLLNNYRDYNGYTFTGVEQRSISAEEDKPLVLGSSETQTRQESTETISNQVEEPIYSYVETPGLTYTIDASRGGFACPFGSIVTPLDGGLIRITEPSHYQRVQTGTVVRVETIEVDHPLITRGFIDQAVTGTSGNDDIRVEGVFRGSVVTQDGDDLINLGSQLGNDDFVNYHDNGDFHPPTAVQGLGAVVDAGLGNDTIIGTDGEDVLSGGEGSNYLDGGRGADTYYVTLSNGSQDTICDSGSAGWSAFLAECYGGELLTDTLVLPSGIAPKDLATKIVDDTSNPGRKILEIRYGSSSVSVVFSDQASTVCPDMTDNIGIERFQFGDGTVMTLAEFIAATSKIPSGPGVSQPIPTQSVDEDSAFSYVIPADAFVGPVVGNEFAYTVTLADGTTLPDWLAFDAETRTFSGTPPTGSAADLTLAITASDLAGATARQEFHLTIAAPSRDPGNAGNDVLVATGGDTVLDGGAGDDQLQGGWGNDTLIGGAGDDVLIAGGGERNVLNGGEGNDRLVADWGADTLDGGEGHNILQAGGGNNVITAGAGNDTISADWGDDTIDAGDGNNVISAGGGNNVITTTGTGTNTITADGNNHITTGAGDDTIDARDGNNRISTGYGFNRVTTGSGNDVISSDGTCVINGGAGNDIVTASWGNDTLDGGAGDDFINGGGGNDLIAGGAGIDVLQGGEGDDWLSDASGATLFDGGAGNDTVSGSDGDEIVSGGRGSDTLNLGAGDDLLLFNRGDGQDTVIASATAHETLSIGGGIAYGDLTLGKTNDDLVLGLGNGDQITFKNWYAAIPIKPVVDLQVIAEAMSGFSLGGSDPLRDEKVEEFNFTGLASAFDTARSADSTLTAWALTNALTDFQLNGSNSAAIGGDLPYLSGAAGTLSGISLVTAQDVIGSGGLGSQRLGLHPTDNGPAATVKLG